MYKVLYYSFDERFKSMWLVMEPIRTDINLGAMFPISFSQVG